MYLKELHIRNFKSIRKADITFPPLTVLVGANAAGKSNFISVFRFLSDIMNRGLETAVSLQGGMEWLANVNLSKSEPIHLSMRIGFDDETVNRIRERRWIDRRDGPYPVRLRDVFYELELSPKDRRVIRDELTVTYIFAVVQQETEPRKRASFQSRTFSARVSRELGESPGSTFKPRDVLWRNDDSLARGVSEKVYQCVKNIWEEWEFARDIGFADVESAKLDEYEPYLRELDILIPRFPKDSLIRVFDFDPKALKRPSPIAAAPTLEENGSNLAAVLKTLFKQREKREKLERLLKDYLPVSENLDVRSGEARTYSLGIQEKYSGIRFPEALLSDGTVVIVALLTALYFERAPIMILEEPERNLHPSLLAALLESARDVSSTRQMILTTHNPELLRHAKVEEVLLASRDAEGFSVFTMPKDSDAVRQFVENDLGLDDLMTQNLLGG